MAMLGKDLQKKKFTTRINPPDHPPEESSRSSTRGYKSRSGPWATGETGKTVNYGSHSTPADSLLFTAKGNVPSNFTLPKIPKNSNAGSKKLFSNAVGSINQNQNAKSSNARTRHSHPQQGPSVSSEQQRSVNIRGRGKGKEKVNDATIDLTNDEDPIEQFSDQGDPPANLHITSRPLQSSSMTEDPLRLPIRSRHNAQVEIKGSQDFQAKSNHNVERQHLTSQGKVITNSFVPQRMYLSAEEGLATLPFPGACACSRLYLEGRDIIFVGQLPLKFEMRFRPQDIDNVFTHNSQKRRFGLQLKAEFRWSHGTSRCGLTKQPPGWSIPSPDLKRITNPPPSGLILFELDSADARVSTEALALLFETLKHIPSPHTTNLDPLWHSWLPPTNHWQKPAQYSLEPPSNNQSFEGDRMTRTSDSDEIEIQPPDRPRSRGAHHFKPHRPSINDINVCKKSKATADGLSTSELECHDSTVKDGHTGTSTLLTLDEPQGLEVEDTDISSLSTRDQSDGRNLEAKDTGTSNLAFRDELMNPQPPSKLNRDRITKFQSQSKDTSQSVSSRTKPNTQSCNSPVSAQGFYSIRPNTRSSTRGKANTPTATSSKPVADDRPIEPLKGNGKRSHPSATGAAQDPQQTADSDIVLVWPYDSEKSTNSVAITQADMRRLEEGEFLNDTLIEFGLKWELDQIRQRDPKVSESIHMFNSFFFHKLSRKSKKKSDVITESKIAYEGVRKWTKGHDLFTKEFVVIPINEHMHWYFIIVANPGKILDAKPPSITAPLNRATRSRSSVASMPEANQSASALPDDEEDQLEDSPHFRKEEAGSNTVDQPAMDVDGSTVALGQMNLENKEDQDMLEVEHDDSSSACVLTLDSLATGSHKAQAKTILRYFINEAKAKRSMELAYEIVDHVAITKVSVPEQPNFCDCGLYLIHAFKTFFEDTSSMMAWIHTNSSRKKKPEDLDWANEVRTTWNAEAAETARQNMKKTVNDCIPGYQKHLEEMKQKKIKERTPKDLSTSNATQPKAGLEGMPPKGCVSARTAEYEQLASQQPAPSSSGIGVNTTDEDVQCLDPPIKPPDQSHTPFRESTSNSSAVKHDGFSRQSKRRRVFGPFDDNSDEFRLRTNQIDRHGNEKPRDLDIPESFRTRKQSGDISMNEATGSPEEQSQRPSEATRTPASDRERTSSLTLTSRLSGAIDHDQTMDIDGTPLESSDPSPSSLQNKFESPPAMQGKIEDHQFIMTPRPNQSVTHHMSPIEQAVINSSRPVALSELSQSRNSTRRASDQHGNSFGAPSQSPVVSDAERKKRDKHRRHPQMTYKDARARDQQPPPNSLFEQFKGPSGEPNDPIQLD